MKRFLTFLTALVLLAGLVLAAGEADDPAVSLSYLESVFTPTLEDEWARRVSAAFGGAYAENLRAAADSRALARLDSLRAAAQTDREAVGTLLLKKDDLLTLLPGCKLSPKYGTLNPVSGHLSDVSGGRAASGPLSAETLYMAGDVCELRVGSASCEVTLHGAYRLAPSGEPDYGSLARVLNALGLFRGAGVRVGYNLEAGASRAEGLVMFLRLLGLEDEALAFGDGCPFSDVPASHWARPYVAYAYAEGLTAGTGPGRFSPDEPVTCQQYATFLLRALHCTEGEDFSYETVLEDLPRLDLLTGSEVSSLCAGSFLRAQMVYLSYRALFGVDRQSGKLLLNELCQSGTVGADQLGPALSLALGGPIK